MRFFFNYIRPGSILKTLVAGILPVFFYLSAFSPYQLYSQISQGRDPLSFRFRLAGEVPEYKLAPPDLDLLIHQDTLDQKNGIPERVGISVPAEIDIIQDGLTEILPDGREIRRIMISCDKARAIGLYFSDFHLVAGQSLFIYDENQSHLLGAYTLYNNKENRLFATELLPFSKIIIELDEEKAVTGHSSCVLSEISYVYKDIPDFLKRRGSSDDCEVNVNCPEGNNWQFQKHSVAKLYVKDGGAYYWCTGSLLNNTLQDNTPFLLTADHCAPTASDADMAQWIFYFNYEASGCEDPAVDPVPNTLTGAEKLASASTSGSDFMLVRLNDDVPENYEPYFNGWSREDIASPNGVTIHHPAGDIKKISTYTTPIESSTWYSTPGTHWQVYWSETETNWGVTEGGSSGAPLFDNNGRVIGTLTGGEASCDGGSGGYGSGPDQPDYFGKFSYSWDQNGSGPSQQLKPWLDPINSGTTYLTGKNSRLTAAFQASETLILKGENVIFKNLSSGIPNYYDLSFEEGNPSSFTGSDFDSIIVKYPEVGSFNVRMIVSDGVSFDTLFYTDYIHVVGKVYPNPTDGVVNIYIQDELPANIKAEVFNIFGQKVIEKDFQNQYYPLLSMDLSLLSSGTYTIRLTIKQRYIFARVILLTPNK
jgi:hypothetical protein